MDISNLLTLRNDLSFGDISGMIDSSYQVLNLRQLREFISGYEFSSGTGTGTGLTTVNGHIDAGELLEIKGNQTTLTQIQQSAGGELDFSINTNFSPSQSLYDISYNWNSIVTSNHDFAFVASPLDGNIVYSVSGSTFHNALPPSVTSVSNQLSSNQALLYIDISSSISKFKYFFINNDTQIQTKRGLYKSKCGNFWLQHNITLISNDNLKTILNAGQVNGNERIIIFSDSSSVYISDDNGVSFTNYIINNHDFTQSAIDNSNLRLNAVWMSRENTIFVAFENGDCYYNNLLDNTDSIISNWGKFQGSVGQNVRSIAYSPIHRRIVVVGSFIFYSFYLNINSDPYNISNLEFIEYETLFYSDFYKVIWDSSFNKFIASGHGYTPLCFSDDATDWDIHYNTNGFELDYPGLYSKKMFYLTYPTNSETNKFNYTNNNNNFTDFVHDVASSEPTNTILTSNNISSICSVYSISNKITEFDENLFKNSTTVQLVNYCNKVRTFGNSCLSGCELLRYFNFYNNALSIGESMFENCTGMTVVSLPYNNDISMVPKNFCKGCTQLSHIELKNNITEIGESAFENAGTATITNKDTLLSISKGRLNQDIVNQLSVIYIPENVTKIGAKAFKGCTNVKYVYFKGSYPDVAGDAFQDIGDANGSDISNSGVVLLGPGFNEDTRSKFAIDASLNIEEIHYIDTNPSNDNKIWYYTGTSNPQTDFDDFCFNNITSLSTYNDNFLNTTNIDGGNITIDGVIIPFNSHIFCIKLSENFNNNISQALFTNSQISIFLAQHSNLTQIDNELFKTNQHLRIIDLPDTVTKFGENSFNGNPNSQSKLQYLKIPKYLKVITKNCFTDSNIYYMDLPNTIINHEANEIYSPSSYNTESTSENTYHSMKNLVNFNISRLSKNSNSSLRFILPNIEILKIPPIFTSYYELLKDNNNMNNRVRLVYININLNKNITFESNALKSDSPNGLNNGNIIHIMNFPSRLTLASHNNFNIPIYLSYLNYTTDFNGFTNNNFNNYSNNFYNANTNNFYSQLTNFLPNAVESTLSFTNQVKTEDGRCYNESITCNNEGTIMATRLYENSKYFIRVYKNTDNFGDRASNDISLNNNPYFGTIIALNNIGNRMFINNIGKIYIYSNDDVLLSSSNWIQSESSLNIIANNNINIPNFVINLSGDKIVYEHNNNIIVQSVDISNAIFVGIVSTSLYDSPLTFINYGRSMSLTYNGNYLAIGNNFQVLDDRLSDILTTNFTITTTSDVDGYKLNFRHLYSNNSPLQSSFVYFNGHYYYFTYKENNVVYYKSSHLNFDDSSEKYFYPNSGSTKIENDVFLSIQFTYFIQYYLPTLIFDDELYVAYTNGDDLAASTEDEVNITVYKLDTTAETFRKINVTALNNFEDEFNFPIVSITNSHYFARNNIFIDISNNTMFKISSLPEQPILSGIFFNDIDTNPVYLLGLVNYILKTSSLNHATSFTTRNVERFKDPHSNIHEYIRPNINSFAHAVIDGSDIVVGVSRFGGGTGGGASSVSNKIYRSTGGDFDFSAVTLDNNIKYNSWFYVTYVTEIKKFIAIARSNEGSNWYQTQALSNQDVSYNMIYSEDGLIWTSIETPGYIHSITHTSNNDLLNFIIPIRNINQTELDEADQPDGQIYTSSLPLSSATSHVNIFNLMTSNNIGTINEDISGEFGFNEPINYNLDLKEYDNSLKLIIGSPEYNADDQTKLGGRIKTYTQQKSSPDDSLSSFSIDISSSYDASNLTVDISSLTTTFGINIADSSGFGYCVRFINENLFSVGMPYASFIDSQTNIGLIVNFLNNQIITEKNIPNSDYVNTSFISVINRNGFQDEQDCFVGKNFVVSDNGNIMNVNSATRDKINSGDNTELYKFVIENLLFNITRQDLTISITDLIYYNNFNTMAFDNSENILLLATNSDDSSLNIIYTILSFTAPVFTTIAETNTSDIISFGLMDSNNIPFTKFIKNAKFEGNIEINDINNIQISNQNLSTYLTTNYIADNHVSNVTLPNLTTRNFLFDQTNVFSTTNSNYVNNLEVIFNYANSTNSITNSVNRNNIVYGNGYFINVFFDNSASSCIHSYNSNDNGITWNNITTHTDMDALSYNDLSNSTIHLHFDSSSNDFYLIFSNITHHLYKLTHPNYSIWTKTADYIDKIFLTLVIERQVEFIYYDPTKSKFYYDGIYIEDIDITTSTNINQYSHLKAIYINTMGAYLKGIYNPDISTDQSYNSLQYTNDQTNWLNIPSTQFINQDNITTFDINVNRHLFKSIAYSDSLDVIVIAGDQSLFYSNITNRCLNDLDLREYIDVSFSVSFNSITYNSSEISFNEVIWSNQNNYFILCGDQCPIFYSIDGQNWNTNNSLINSDISTNILAKNNSSLAFNDISNILNVVQTSNDPSINLIRTNENKVFGNENLDITIQTLDVRKINASQLNFTDLPITDPHHNGRLWNENGTLKISLG